MPEKSSAQRLRAVLYRLWEKRGRNGEFEKYYQTSMEKFINRIKKELE